MEVRDLIGRSPYAMQGAGGGVDNESNSLFQALWTAASAPTSPASGEQRAVPRERVEEGVDVRLDVVEVERDPQLVLA